MKEKPDAWMPLYVADWDSGTRHLDCEQDGAYGRLVRHYWRNGPLPDDDAALARIIGAPVNRWRKLRPILITFFTIRDGRWVQKRVEEELERWGKKRLKAIEKAKEAAKKRWKKDAPSTPQAMLEQCPSSSPSEGRASKRALPLTGREAPVLPADGKPALTPEQMREIIEAENVVFLPRSEAGA